MCSHEEYEQHLKELIDNPEPEPKYQLWQVVRYRTGYRGKTLCTAKICGFYFTRVSIALAEECEPGWSYHIEGKETMDTIREEDIVEVVSHA